MGTERHSCFECGGKAKHAHHIVPKSLGGKRTIPLCLACHGAVHRQDLALPALVRKGIAAAKARGVIFGRPRKLSAEALARAVELRQTGLSLRAITKILNAGVSKSTVERELKRKP